MRINKPMRLFAATLLAGALAVAGAALPATADENPPVANINPDAVGSLTIHKFEQPAELGDATHGEEVDTTGLSPLSGVEFTITPVTNVDLTTYEGWEGMADLTPADVTLGTPLAPQETVGGVTTFNNLPVGVYLVQETNTANATNADGDPVTITVSAPAFLVSIPAPIDGAWVYDIHAYPKNASNALEKEVDDTGAVQLGDEVTWTITGSVPVMPGGTELERVTIVDTLDSRLDFVSATVTVGGDVLTEGTDYTLTYAAGTVTIELTDPAAHQGEPIVVELVTTVESLGDGVIENDATQFINDSEIDSNTVDTKWGELKAIKHGGDDKGNVLAGATFDLYDVDPSTEDATPIATGLQSGTDGSIHHPGLKVDNTTGQATYWLVETAAPAGYVLPTDMADRTTEILVTTGPAGAVDVLTHISNAQQPPFTLPLTGGTGTLLFTLGGMVLVATAAGIYLRNRSRANASA